MKKFLILSVFTAVFLIMAPGVKADSFFGASFDILYDPSLGYHEAQYAPSTLGLVFYAYSETDNTVTRFRFDCTSDGRYDADVTLASNNRPQKMGNGYTIQGGEYWRYVQPTSPWDAWWAQDVSANLAKCYYPLKGDYTITMLAERGGIKVVSTRSFSLREPTVDSIIRPFYKTKYIRGGLYENNVPVAPANVDLALNIWNPLRSKYTYWPLFTNSATLKFDCDGNGTIDKTDSWPNPASNSQKSEFCVYFDPSSSGFPRCLGNFGNYDLSYYSNVCSYKDPGIHTVKVIAELARKGADPYINEMSTEFPVISKNSATVDFSTGGDPTQSAGILRNVDLKLNVANIILANASYKFSCGNGQIAEKSINIDYSKKNYDQDYSVLMKDFCNYDAPGEYTAKAELEFRTNDLPLGVRNTLPFDLVKESGNYMTYSVKKEIKILVTGKISENEYMVSLPFDLKWDVSGVSSCKVTGVNDTSFDTSGIGVGRVNVKNALRRDIPYFYKLICTADDGSSVERIIKVIAR